MDTPKSTTDSSGPPWSIIVACVLGIGTSLWNLSVLMLEAESSVAALLMLGWFDVLLIGILFFAFLGIDFGRNLLLVFVGLWIFVEVASLVTPESVHSSDDIDLLGLASILIFPTVVVLLFVPASNRWYRRNDVF